LKVKDFEFQGIKYDIETQKKLLGKFYKENIQIPIFKLNNEILLDFPRFAFTKELKEEWKPEMDSKNITFLGVTGSKIILFI
jgi:hypothetical protein